MNEEDKLIQEQLQKLPPELQKAIELVPWKSSVKEIAISNDLSFEQVEIVERETMFIIYGFENPADYVENIMREVGIDEETATRIAEAVDEKILKLINQKTEGVSETPQAAPTPTEVAPPNLPVLEPDFAQSNVVVKEGEKAHDVPAMKEEEKAPEPTLLNPEPEQPIKPRVSLSVPDYRYPSGKDPYREPIE